MKSKTFRKLTAIMLSLILTLSMCMVGVTASAADTEEGTQTLYLVPNSNWLQSNARFALYVFGGGKDAWTSMTDVDEDGVYEVTVPAGTWDGYIFVRMNPDTTVNNWNNTNKWNQTADLTIPEGMNCYTVKAATWDKGGGTWSHYVPGGELPTEGPTEPPILYDYTVAGDEGLTGEAWNPAANGMTDEDGDGVYTITFKDVPANSYSFKVTDGTWNNSWGNGTDNYSITLTAQADVTINFDSATKEITVISDGLGEFKLEYIAVVGNGAGAWLNGEEWNTATTTNKLTQVAPGVWTITYTNVDASDDYQVKFIANGSYTYNWTSDGVFDGQLNPSNVVEYDGSTVTLTIDLTKYDFATKTGKVVTSFTVKPPVEIPTEEPTDPVEVDYCLFGYIDGADYGDGEDFENIGDYVFEDGTVTATFNETSYVGVKTTDNATWFMTDGWAGEVKEVVLYDSALLDENADKLMIPVTPGTSTKATFTLVENEDGTLTLSYKAETILPEKMSIYGGINVDLTETDADIYTGVTELQAGTYTFNLNDMGTVRGMNFTYTDTATINYSAGYKAATTLNVSGGRYTFTYNAATKILKIRFKSFEDIVELVGDINAELVRPNKNTTVFTGTVRLDAGSYKFNVNEHGEIFGLNFEFDDTVYNKAFIYKSAATLNATGGIYSVRYDTADNVIKILKAPEGLGDVIIFGDIALPLAAQGNGVFSAQTILEAGSYNFRVDSFGTFFGNGTEFTDTINTEFKTEWKAAATLNVTEKMKFTFFFDTNTNKVKVFNAPIDTTKVKVAFDDIDALVLTSEDGVIFNGTVTLEAGTYTFRMDEFGTPMGGKYTFTDNSTGAMTYNATYASATTMTATGGDYTFTYNVNTDKLVVGKV